jgi:hypothetical protein
VEISPVIEQTIQRGLRNGQFTDPDFPPEARSLGKSL